MNLDTLISSSAIRSETLTATLNRHNYPSNHQTMPQRSPFAIQELLGLSDSSRQTSSGNNSINQSSVTSGSIAPSIAPSVYSQTNSVDHHQMQMASRMAYFNAHAAAFNVAAAFLPHNMSSPTSGPLGLHPQTSGMFKKSYRIVCKIQNQTTCFFIFESFFYFIEKEPILKNLNFTTNSL